MDYNTLLATVNKLKDVKRTGWTRYPQIESVESVADHCFMVAFLALTIPLPENVNRERLIKMAIVHDTTESLVGDIVFEQGQSKDLAIFADKKEKENAAIRTLFAEHPQHIASYDEYEALEKAEAKFLKELDKLEMAHQALQYELTYGADLQQFFDNVDAYVKTPQVRAVLTQILEKRNISSR